jgi:hypothetical protein
VDSTTIQAVIVVAEEEEWAAANIQVIRGEVLAFINHKCNLREWT